MKVVDDLDYDNVFCSIDADIWQLDKDISTKLKVNGSQDKKSKQRDGNTSSTGASPKQGRKCGRPANPVPRHKRDSHIKAEYRRRDKIQKGFDTLRELVPALEDCSPKESKAAMLLKTAEHCRQIKAECKTRQDELSVLRQEIEALGSQIHLMQQHLPATGLDRVDKPQSSMDQSYAEYVRERTADNWKFWLFSFIMDPLYKAYKKATVAATRNSILQAVAQWATDNLSLPSLRPGVFASLREISKKTSVMDKPDNLWQEAMSKTRTSSLSVPSSPASPTTSQSSVVCPSPRSSGMSSTTPPPHQIPSQSCPASQVENEIPEPVLSLADDAWISENLSSSDQITTSSALNIDTMMTDSFLESLTSHVEINTLQDLNDFLPSTTFESLSVPTTTMDSIMSTQSMNSSVLLDGSNTVTIPVSMFEVDGMMATQSLHSSVLSDEILTSSVSSQANSFMNCVSNASNLSVGTQL